MTGIEILTSPAPTVGNYALLLVPTVLGTLLVVLPLFVREIAPSAPRKLRVVVGVVGLSLIGVAFWSIGPTQAKLDAMEDAWSRTITNLEDTYEVTFVDHDDVPQDPGSTLLVAVDRRTNGALALAVINDGDHLTVRDASSDAHGDGEPFRAGDTTDGPR